MEKIYLTRKKKKGKYIHLYLEGRAWIDGRSRRTWQKYLGPEHLLKDINLSGLLSKNAKQVETETLEFGISAALWQIAKEIGIVDKINEVAGKSRDQNLSLGDYLIIAAINRCAAPCSKSKLSQWFTNDWLGTKYDIDPLILNAQTYWNHFQYLTEEKIEKIQLRVIKDVVKDFSLSLEGLLYDPTNFYTFSKGGRGWREGNGSEFLRFGNNKEKRNDKRQVAFWLICDRDSGVPLFHYTYPGNCQDAGIFKEMPKRNKDEGETGESVPARVVRYLESLDIKPNKVTMVFDNGNLSKEGMKHIEEGELKFIASRRPSTHKSLLHTPLTKFTDYIIPVTGKPIKYYRTVANVYGKSRTIYVTLDPAKQKKKVCEFRTKMVKKQIEIKEFFADRLDPKKYEMLKGQGQKWLKRSEVEKKVRKMIGRAPLKNVIIMRVEGPDEVDVNSNERIEIFIKIDNKAQTSYEETLGRSILFTNQESWEAGAVIWGYRQQYIVEHAFRQMKCTSSISVRPMFHHTSMTIPAHVFICYLSYLLLSLLRLKLMRKGCPASFEEILESLRAAHVTLIYPSKNVKPIIKMDRMDGLVKRISKHLDFKHLL
jgi:transposase